MALVVSILEADFETLARRALRAAASADALELRLDRLPDASERELAELIAALDRPVIVAVNGPANHGSFTGTAAQRRALLQRAARAGASFVDIDWREAAELTQLPPTTRRIVSRHEKPSVVSARYLERELRERARAGDWLKLVVETRNAADGLELLSLLADSPGDLIAFSSGVPGSFTRVLAPILGSPLTYASADPEPGEAPRATAPGQLAAAELRAAWPVAGVGPDTSIFAVVGSPVAHSISPRVHTSALRAAAVDAVFVALDVADLRQTLALCAARNWRGFAVTAPHKPTAFKLASAHDVECRLSRASNTLVRGDVGWNASNTDVEGVRGALRAAARGRELPVGRALVLGAGGAARAALVALELLGFQAVVTARDARRAEALAAEFGTDWLPWNERAAHETFGLVVQCTPVQTDRHQPLLADAALAPDALVLEALYRPLETPLVQAARRRGATVATGADWFLHQAERQFELFTGQRAPEGVMREAISNALA